MAFKVIEGTRGQAISVDQKTKSFTGYLLDKVDVYKAKKGKNATIVLHFQNMKGETVRMFAGYSLRSAVLNEDGTVKKPLVNCLFKITWKEKVKLKGGKSMNRLEIAVDMAKKAPKVKEQVPF